MKAHNNFALFASSPYSSKKETESFITAQLGVRICGDLFQRNIIGVGQRINIAVEDALEVRDNSKFQG